MGNYLCYRADPYHVIDRTTGRVVKNPTPGVLPEGPIIDSICDVPGLPEIVENRYGGGKVLVEYEGIFCYNAGHRKPTMTYEDLRSCGYNFTHFHVQKLTAQGKFPKPIRPYTWRRVEVLEALRRMQNA
jgi:hypothetical protein